MSPERDSTRVPQVLIVLVNCPDPETAARLRRGLVEAGLAACVNQLPAVTSTYRWQGAVEEAVEIPLLIKTTRTCYPDLEAEVRRLHPYTVPEIVAVAVECGLAAYLDWVVAGSDGMGAGMGAQSGSGTESNR